MPRMPIADTLCIDDLILKACIHYNMSLQREPTL